LILRIATGQFKAQVPLENKFGCPGEKCPILLKKAKELGLDVVGVG
jgi:diaminopimelate decarboxylase